MVRHFLTMTDLSAGELRHLLREAVLHKQRRSYGQGALKGKTIALVFQKPSMRTRVSFEVAVTQLGGSATYLGQEDIQLGAREPIKDVARVLSRYVDGIVVRTFAHQNVEECATYASVPVINGLSDLVHPCQALADLMTIQEQMGRLNSVRVCYIGDGNNVLHALAEGCGLLGLQLSVSTPPRYKPDPALWRSAVRLANAHGGALRWDADPHRAVRGAQVVYTDVWTSMGKEGERSQRRRVFMPYQVNQALLRLAAPGYRVMHCLPAHRGEEMTDQVMESKHSIIFEQAENRLHAQKALLVHLLATTQPR